MTGIGSPTVVEGQRPLERALGVLLCCSCAGVESVVLPCASTPPSGPLVPILVTASATPLATNRVRVMVATNRMVRFIKRSPLAFPYPTTSFGWLRPNDTSFFPKSRSRSRRGLLPSPLLLLVYPP